MSFVTSLNWRLKLLIAGATMVAAAVAIAVGEAGSTEIWSGRTTMTIGLVPNLRYLMISSSDTNLAAIESPRQVAARISDPLFRAEVLNQVKFEPATTARSRSLAASTMRGIALEGDRDVAIELSAASPADVEAAFRALRSQIEKVHGAMLDDKKRFLQEKIANDKGLMWCENSLLLNRPPIPSIERDTNLLRLSEPSIMHLEPGTFVEGRRSVAALRASLLTGFAMLVAMVALTTVINLRTQPPAR
jgi:hypothetical protein